LIVFEKNFLLEMVLSSLKWASYVMRTITKVKIKVNNIIYDQIKRMDKEHSLCMLAVNQLNKSQIIVL
jgi:hypothetical protein